MTSRKCGILVISMRVSPCVFGWRGGERVGERNKQAGPLLASHTAAAPASLPLRSSVPRPPPHPTPFYSHS